jgi:hypothetical protein
MLKRIIGQRRLLSFDSIDPLLKGARKRTKHYRQSFVTEV